MLKVCPMKVNHGDILERYPILKSSLMMDDLIPIQNKIVQNINSSNDPPPKELNHEAIKSIIIGLLVDTMDQFTAL